jgi:hypothetical protein
MRTIEVIFSDGDNNLHTLKYKIYDTRLAKKWLAVIRENQSDLEKYIHTAFYNATGKNIPTIHKDLTDKILKINKEYDIPLPVFGISKINGDNLNKLHSMFEHYGDRIPELKASNRYTKELNSYFLDLNELIHIYELALGNQNRNFPTMALTMDYYPQTIFRNIEPLDKLSVKNRYDWGQLFLGYNTLGKDWLTVCCDNDLDLVMRETVKPQKRFAAETWFSFSELEYSELSPIAYFENWYHSLPAELKLKVPIENVSDLVLGKFLIGEIIIDDYFLNFDPDMTNWIIPNSESKKKWNNDVFSTFKKVEKLRILK